MSSALTSARSARFIVLSDREAPSANRDRELSISQRLTWRVVAGNNRPLGRSLVSYAAFEECVAATVTLRQRVAELKPVVVFDHAEAMWRWTVTLDDTPVAASVREYSRRVECTRSLGQFLEILSSAPPVEQIHYAGLAMR